MRSLGALSIVAGVALTAWAGVTWALGDPFTSLYTKRQQGRLAASYERRAEACQGSARLVAEPGAGQADAVRRSGQG